MTAIQGAISKPARPGLCEFRVIVCLNNSDPNLPLCVPNGISSIEVRSPRPESARAAALRNILAADKAALQTALQHLADPQNPAAGYTNGPPLAATQQGFCSAPFAIAVPVTVFATRGSRQSVTLKTRSTNNRLPAPLVNLSKLKLTCSSHPVP